MTDNAQLTIGGEPLDEQVRIETTGRVIRPFQRMISALENSNPLEYRMRVADDGLHVRTIDAPNVMYVDITQPAETLDTVEIDDETMLGLNDPAFASILSDARYGKSTDDPITLTSDGSTLESVVDRDYGGVEATVTDRLSLVDLDMIREGPDPLDLDRVSIDLPPQALIDVLGSFEDKYVAMSVTDGTVRFGSETDATAREIELDVDADADVAETLYSRDYTDQIVKGLRNGYPEETTLYLGEDVPMSIEFATEQGAVGEYCLAPRLHTE